jgi:hypothetical protein
MSQQESAAVITGRAIGIIRLKTLISALKLEMLGMKKRGDSAYKILKRELHCKGDKQGVLNYANEVLESVRDW